MLGFSKNFLVDLKMSSELLEYFVLVSLCIFYLANVFQKVLEHFSHSSSHLILAQIIALLIVYSPLGVSSLANFQSLV